MDYLSSSSFGPTYPQNQNDEIFQNPFFDSLNPYESQDHNQQDIDLEHLLRHIPDTLTQENSLFHHQHHDELTQNNHDQQRRKGSKLVFDDDHNYEGNVKNADDRKRQKIVHREIERQRRLEMSSLHANLRSLLPVEHIKGKRSMSDHLDETVKYIKHLQERIRVLSGQRDALKTQVSNNPKDANNISVKCCHGGLEVIFSSSSDSDGNSNSNFGRADRSGGLPLSRVFQCLAKQGLDVVSCISNKVDNMFVHSIQAQVGDERSNSIDAVELQKKLAAYI